jgi:hypothetical protein
MEEFFERFFEGLMSTYRVDDPYVLTAEETAELEAKQQVFTGLTEELTFQGALEASNREREQLNTTEDITLTYGEAVRAT